MIMRAEWNSERNVFSLSSRIVLVRSLFMLLAIAEWFIRWFDF